MYTPPPPPPGQDASGADNSGPRFPGNSKERPPPPQFKPQPFHNFQHRPRSKEKSITTWYTIQGTPPPPHTIMGNIPPPPSPHFILTLFVSEQIYNWMNFYVSYYLSLNATVSGQIQDSEIACKCKKGENYMGWK